MVILNGNFKWEQSYVKKVVSRNMDRKSALKIGSCNITFKGNPSLIEETFLNPSAVSLVFPFSLSTWIDSRLLLTTLGQIVQKTFLSLFV